MEVELYASIWVKTVSGYGFAWQVSSTVLFSAVMITGF